MSTSCNSIILLASLSTVFSTFGGTVELVTWLAALRRHWMTILNCVALGLVLAGLVNLFAPKHYESTATLYVVSSARMFTATEYNQGAMLVSSRMPSYPLLIRSPLVLLPVIEALSLDETVSDLAGRVRATSPPGSNVLQITVTGDRAGLTQQTAESVMEHFRQAGPKLDAQGSSTAPIALVVADHATPPAQPISPYRLRNLLIGVGAGVLVASVILFFKFELERIRISPTQARLTYLDDTGRPVTVTLSLPYSLSVPSALQEATVVDGIPFVHEAVNHG